MADTAPCNIYLTGDLEIRKRFSVYGSEKRQLFFVVPLKSLMEDDV
jgi:hypothetical protein